MSADLPVTSLNSPSVEKHCRAHLDEAGFVIVEDAYAPDELHALREGILSLEARATREKASFVYHSADLWAIWNLYELSPSLMRLALAPNVFRLVAQSLGEPAEFARATMMKKVPGGAATVSWHQDTSAAVERDLGDANSSGIRDGVPHRRVARDVLDRMLVARINVEPQYSDGGCLAVIPASHKWGKLAPDESMRRAEQSTPLLCPVPAGSVLFYRPLLAHSSGPNTRVDPHHQRRVIHNEFRAVSTRPCGAVDWYRWRNSARCTEEGVLFRSAPDFKPTAGN
jgi:ectoine hydroxylase-related dioxygenase (phytanoyl-CoA dioxygenase family)